MKISIKIPTIVIAVVPALALSSPARADEPAYLSFRPFAMVSEQEFSAVNTFNAVLGQAQQMFWGGGISITQEDRYYVDLAASEFKKTGQRAFMTNIVCPSGGRCTGDVFRLGIPVRTKLLPLELTGGYRFHRWRHIVPYAGGGVGIYRYVEESDFANAGDNLDIRHVGGILEGGVEVRFHRWVGAGVDVHYTHIPGILGEGGISKDVQEKDLGGVSARFRVLVGR